jgi:hypothetical protein
MRSRKRQFTDAQIIAALKKTKGLVYLAARLVGCSTETIYERRRTNEDVGRTIKEERGTIVDKAEQKLARAIDKGESWAIAMVLRTLGKDRGYVERSEVKVSGAELDSLIEAELERLRGRGETRLPPAAAGHRNGEAGAG